MSKLKIVYFGSPEFAAYILEKMTDSCLDIRGVVTMPDKPAGRGHRPRSSAVKETALRLLPGVPVLQPEKLRDEVFLDDLRDLSADLFVVVAFRMLPPEVWTMPERGTFNLHASLLPRYRGAAPIQRVLMDGEEKTGVTAFFLNEEIDKGRIILRKETPVSRTETGGSLYDRLMKMGADAVLETISLIEKSTPGAFLGRKQSDFYTDDELPLPTAPKIFKPDRALLFRETEGVALERLVRAMNPYPAAFMTHEDGTEYKVFRADLLPSQEGMAAGDFKVTHDRRLIIQSLRGALEILELQAPSKKRTSAADFLLGNSLPGGRFL